MKPDDDQSTPVELAAASIALAREALEHAQEALAQIERARSRQESSGPSKGTWSPEWGTLGQAQNLLQRGREASAAIINKAGLGRNLDGRWRVDLARVRAYLAGEPFPPLT